MEMTISRDEILDWMSDKRNKDGRATVLDFAIAHNCDVSNVWRVINGNS